MSKQTANLGRVKVARPAVIPPAFTAKEAPTLQQLERDLNLACEGVEEALLRGAACARVAGGILLQVKQQLGHGQWLPWLKDRFRYSEKTAQNWMRLAERWADLESHLEGKSATVADLGVREALEMLAEMDARPLLALPAPVVVEPEAPPAPRPTAQPAAGAARATAAFNRFQSGTGYSSPAHPGRSRHRQEGVGAGAGAGQVSR